MNVAAPRQLAVAPAADGDAARPAPANMRHPLEAFDRATLWHLLHHYAPERSSDNEVYIAENLADPADLPIAGRLMNVFHRMVAYEASAIPPERRPNAGIWEMIRHQFHGDIYRILAGRDVALLADYLRNVLRRSFAYGLGPGREVFEAMRLSGAGRDANVTILTDRLAAVAVAIGALPQENPEQGRYGENMRMPVAEIVALIEARLGMEISRPPVAGLFGVLVGPRKIIDVRVPDDVYSAFRLQTICEQHGFRTVCEIGAGFGGTAFQFSRHRAERYTIIDLPVINLLQGFFLMKVFGGDAVKMFGENIEDRRFNVLPYWEIGDRRRSFDLVFNRDSMPEMPAERALEYLHDIAERGVAFLSINQEAAGPGGPMGGTQLNVHQLAKRVPQLRSVGRHPYWIRKGYVEELFLPA